MPVGSPYVQGPPPAVGELHKLDRQSPVVVAATIQPDVGESLAELDAILESEDLPARMLLQVHDELVLEVREDEKEAMAKLVVDTMEGVFDLNVPLVVDHSFGSNWAEAKA